MNGMYLIRSVLECGDRELVCQSGLKLCTLGPSAETIVLVLSVLTNAASIGYKAARNDSARFAMPLPALPLRHCQERCQRAFAPSSRLMLTDRCAEAELLRTMWVAEKQLHAQRAALIDQLERSATEVKTAQKKLGDTRKSVFAVLETSLSPELASQVQNAIDQRLQDTMHLEDEAEGPIHSLEEAKDTLHLDEA
jgi:hypothetical protein